MVDVLLAINSSQPENEWKKESEQSAAVISPALSLSLYLSGREGRRLWSWSQGRCDIQLQESPDRVNTSLIERFTPGPGNVKQLSLTAINISRCANDLY